MSTPLKVLAWFGGVLIAAVVIGLVWLVAYWLGVFNANVKASSAKRTVTARVEQKVRGADFAEAAYEQFFNDCNARLNDPNKITYIYLVALNGNVVAHDTAEGPITPCSTQILPDSGPVLYRGTDLVVPQPEPNGTFAGNEADCIFWFTPQGAYREWTGNYFMSDQPVLIQNPVNLVVNANAAITHSVHAKSALPNHLHH